MTAPIFFKGSFLKKLICLVAFFYSYLSHCQTLPFKELNKWGIKENEKVIIKPVYDTAFNFDEWGKVCMVCNKGNRPSANKFIKVMGTTYFCNYLNRQGKRLMIIPEGSDTACSIFSLTSQAVNQYQEDSKYIVATVKNRKYLVTKDFKQVTYKDYSEIYFTSEPGFIMPEIKNEGNVILKGLIDLQEKTIIPFLYSNIKFNTHDSLIIACSAGIGINREDDVYNYTGKKLAGYRRHVDMATPKFIIHKIFEPKEYYIIYNNDTKEEKIIYGQELQLRQNDEVLIKNGDQWFTYNMVTNAKTSFDPKPKK
ncbi:MAG: hypothetical protein JWO32_337 [Bacteroidetes bacterium]|nr:hypothetical protein [Bacteroidota bacterium]